MPTGCKIYFGNTNWGLPTINHLCWQKFITLRNWVCKSLNTSGSTLTPVEALHLTSPILFINLCAHSLVRSMYPPFSISRFESFASIIPLAAAKVMVVFTTPPRSRTPRKNCFTYDSTSSPTSNGLPLFFSLSLVTSVKEEAVPSEDSSLLNRFIYPSSNCGFFQILKFSASFEVSKRSRHSILRCISSYLGFTLC